MHCCPSTSTCFL
uniref:Uncharacterized protein n=1 Tax=Anguilla anguilla TaxID=7936 RepID=A0A0E9XTJ6_ANGAN